MCYNRAENPGTTPITAPKNNEDELWSFLLEFCDETWKWEGDWEENRTLVCQGTENAASKNSCCTVQVGRNEGHIFLSGNSYFLGVPHSKIPEKVTLQNPQINEKTEEVA